MAALIDGNLGSDEREALVQHLAECEQCRDLLAAYARAQSDVDRDTSPRIVRSGIAWMSAAALVMVALTAGLLMSRRPPGELITIPANTTVAVPPPAAQPRPLPPARQRQPAEDLSARRSGTRQLGGKTFRLEAGEWIDTAHDPLALLPVEIISEGDRDAAAARVPDLRPYLELGPRFTVVHEGTVYRFGAR